MPNVNATPPATLIAQLDAAQITLDLTDLQLCEALGFERPVVLTLIKAGTMKLPLAKVPALAKALRLDAAELMRTALRESSPELLEAIEEALNPLRLSATEVNLITHLRKLSGDQIGAPIVLDGKGVIALVAV